MKPTTFILIMPVLILGLLSGCTGAFEKNPANETGKTTYFGVEINQVLCGYSIASEQVIVRQGKTVKTETNEAQAKLTILGQGMDLWFKTSYTTDLSSGKVVAVDSDINSGNTRIISNTVIEHDTAIFTSNTGQQKKKLFISQEVIFETSSKSPHLFNDFIKNGLAEKTYRVYEPIGGEVIEKKYTRKNDEEVLFNDSTYKTLVLEETDLSNGTKGTIWLCKSDSMIVKMLIAGRNIYLADASVVKRISMVNYDNVIFARVNRIIPDFQRSVYMKVRVKVMVQGSIITGDDLNFPGQVFTGTVEENLVEGIFEIEPVRYDGSGSPAFPPDFKNTLEMQKYLEPEIAVESNEPRIVKEAQKLTDGAPNAWEAAKLLSRWVASNIKGAIPGGGSAINTYRMREGECGGHSRLLVAFCRSVGIPARLSSGCFYTPHYGGSFGQHAWTEVYMGDAGWIPIDATIYETDHIDAGHIRFGEKISFQPVEMEILDYRIAQNF
ncbi:MAG: transglutaminase-like domain-containing protein [Bacteroidales bacterium]|jgi:hypothetical protein|nr:transglutaminase-like domain-containing protein [Bacteroidales bacterium]